MTDVTGPTVASARRRAPVPPYPDLASAWLAELASAPGPGLPHQLHVRGTGRHGWLHECGAVASLAPLFPGPVDLEGGIAGFRDLGGPVASGLLEVLPEEFLATERQNDGPTVGAVLRAVAAHPDEVVAHGYLVSPRRCDERITVEGVLLRSPRDLRCSARTTTAASATSSSRGRGTWGSTTRAAARTRSRRGSRRTARTPGGACGGTEGVVRVTRVRAHRAASGEASCRTGHGSVAPGSPRPSGPRGGR